MFNIVVWWVKGCPKKNLANKNLNCPQIQKFEGLTYVFLHSSLSAIDKLLCQKTLIKPSNFWICGQFKFLGARFFFGHPLGYRNWLPLKKCRGRDLNPRPLTIRASALPTELQVHDSSECEISASQLERLISLSDTVAVTHPWQHSCKWCLEQSYLVLLYHNCAFENLIVWLSATITSTDR